MTKFLQRVADENGELLAEVLAIRAGTGMTATYVPDAVLTGSPEHPGSVAGYVTLAANGNAVSGQDITPASVTTTGNVTVGGLLFQGGGLFAHGKATTTGGATQPLAGFAVPLADDSAIAMHLTMTAFEVVSGRFAFFDESFGMKVVSGTPTPLSGGSQPATSFYLVPTYLPSWSAGTMTIAVTGPIGHITATADAGGGATQITITEAITSDITGQSLTVAGTSNTPGLNGAHTATFVDVNNFTVPVAFGSGDTSGTVVETSPRTIVWAGLALGVVAPAP